jgi:EmrB/QacA subfamily drug resistance transporter
MTKQAEDVLAKDVADELAAEAATVLEEPRAKGLRAWIVPLIVGTALFMQNFNANSITTALPAMAHEFHIDPVGLNIAITAYLLGVAVFLPLSGWIADRFGARRVFMIAMALFAVMSVFCGLSNSVVSLLVFRVLQGGVGALLAPVGRMVLLRSTPKTEIVAAMAVFTMPALVGPLLGPVLGGAIVTYVSWRWIFFINIPIAIAGLLLIRAYVPDVMAQATSRLDWIGNILIGLTLAALIFGCGMLGRDQLPAPAVAGLFALGVVCAVLYAFHARRAAAPVIDLAMFRIPTFRASVMGFAFLGIVPTTMPFLLAMLLQVSFGMSALHAGFIAFTTAIGSLAMRTTAPGILRRFGFRDTLVFTCVTTAVLTAACALFRPGTPAWIMVVVLIAGGFSRSLQATSVNGMTYAELEASQMSRATTTSAVVQQFAQSVAICLAALLLQATVAIRGETHLSWQAVAPAFIIVAAISMIAEVFFIPLPRDAGDDMNNRGPKAARP